MKLVQHKKMLCFQMSVTELHFKPDNKAQRGNFLSCLMKSKV